MVNMYSKALILFSHMLCCLQFNALSVRSVSQVLHFHTHTLHNSRWSHRTRKLGFYLIHNCLFLKCGIMDMKLKIIQFIT
jgi:hypothetical protein